MHMRFFNIILAVFTVFVLNVNTPAFAVTCPTDYSDYMDSSLSGSPSLQCAFINGSGEIIDANRIADRFHSLSSLRIDNVLVKNANALSSLPLVELDISSINYENVAQPILNLERFKSPLKHLEIEFNTLQNLDSINSAANTLDYLELEMVSILDVNQSLDLPVLTTASFDRTDLGEIKSVNLPKLKTLSILNSIDDNQKPFSPFQVELSLPELTSLYITNVGNATNGPENLPISPVPTNLIWIGNEKTPKMTELQLEGVSSIGTNGGLTNLNTLRGLKSLTLIQAVFSSLEFCKKSSSRDLVTQLTLGGDDAIEGFGDISGCHTIQNLQVDSKKAFDLQAVAGLKSLSSLVLQASAISNPQVLNNLSGIKTLLLTSNDALDIETYLPYLKNMKGLETLSLEFQSIKKVRDITELKSLKSLKSLTLNSASNNITSEDMHFIYNNFPGIQVSFNFVQWIRY